MDNKLIYKDKFNDKLSTDEVFIEGSVRLQIEMGEMYFTNQILLRVIIEINKKKDNQEFIGDPSKVKISDIKSEFCKNLGVKPEDFRFYRVNEFKDPVKQIKNENLLLCKSGFKDTDTLYMKNINEDPYENYIFRFYMNIEDKNQDKEDKDSKAESFFYKAILEVNMLQELLIQKNTSLFDLKKKVVQELTLSIDDMSYLRLRCMSKCMDAERILRGHNIPVKKQNTDNPANLLIEILQFPEDLHEHQMQLYLVRKNKTTNNYETKDSFIFEFEGIATSDQLYEASRKFYNLRDIVLGKYSKGNYKWELLPEIDEDGALNLRKSPYALRDGGKINN